MTIRDHREDGVVQVPQGITRVTINKLWTVSHSEPGH